MHKRVPWHLLLSLSTQAQSPPPPPPPCLWGALSSWQPCGSLWCSLGTLGYLFLHRAAEGKDTRLSLKRKKKKLDWHWRDRVLTRRPRWPKISCSKKDARHDDKVLTCLGSLIHLALNCATFCATNLHLSRVCKDQENAHFLSMSPQGLLRDHDLMMGWGYKGLFTGVSVCVLGFVWAFVEDHILFCRIHVHVCPSVECNIRKPRSCNLTGCCSD